MLVARIAVPFLTLLATGLVLPSCGDAPQRVEPDSAPRGAASAPAHAVPSTFTGVAILEGALAERDGYLMVSVRMVGVVIPLMSYRISLAEAPPARDGRREVPFQLDPSSNALGAGLPGEAAGFPLEISVRFDADGMVETTEGDVTVNQAVEPGASGIEVVLGA